jgi:hypothetical protein
MSIADHSETKKGWLVFKMLERSDLDSGFDPLKSFYGGPKYVSSRGWTELNDFSGARWFQSVDEASQFIFGEDFQADREFLGVDSNRLLITEIVYQTRTLSVEENTKMNIHFEDARRKLTDEQFRAVIKSR